MDSTLLLAVEMALDDLRRCLSVVLQDVTFYHVDVCLGETVLWGHRQGRPGMKSRVRDRSVRRMESRAGNQRYDSGCRAAVGATKRTTLAAIPR